MCGSGPSWKTVWGSCPLVFPQCVSLISPIFFRNMKSQDWFRIPRPTHWKCLFGRVGCETVRQETQPVQLPAREGGPICPSFGAAFSGIIYSWRSKRRIRDCWNEPWHESNAIDCLNKKHLNTWNNCTHSTFTDHKRARKQELAHKKQWAISLPSHRTWNTRNFFPLANHDLQSIGLRPLWGKASGIRVKGSMS